MNFFHAIFLGLLQGVTEFLPISSSGHLALVEFFLGINEAGLTFDVALHLGTLLGVLIYFRRDFFNPKTGEPLILPIEGRGRTFQGLVLRSIGRNITIKTVLDRLLSSGNIRTITDGTDQVEMLSLFYSPITNDRAKMTDIAFIESSRVLSAAIHNMNSDIDSRVPQQGRWTYRLSPTRYREFRKEARLLLQKQIKEGEALLENFEDSQKQPGQLTVGIGWYQWGGHHSDEEGVESEKVKKGEPLLEKLEDSQ